MTSQSAGVWSSRACRATLPFEGLIYARSAVTLAPTFLAGARGLPVFDDPLVGGLGLLGELALGLADRDVAAPDPAGRLGVLRRAGGDLQPAQLALGQRRLLVGVVLTAREHAPEQDRELAGGRDDRLAVTAARARAVIEGVQRTGLQDDAPGGLDQRPAGGGASRAC